MLTLNASRLVITVRIGINKLYCNMVNYFCNNSIKWKQIQKNKDMLEIYHIVKIDNIIDKEQRNCKGTLDISTYRISYRMTFCEEIINEKEAEKIRQLF